MREFFRGWKRKLGVVTLMVACVLTGGWIRSLTHAESVRFVSGEKTDEIWLSGEGKIAWLRNQHSSHISGPPEWRSDPAYFFNSYFTFGKVTWKWRFLSFSATERLDDGSGVRKVCYIAPYWSIVLPMSLLSAWLLLSKTTNASASANIGAVIIGSYFRPWQRKLGVVTLLLACLFAVGWVRSLYAFEEIVWRFESLLFGALSVDQTILFAGFCVNEQKGNGFIPEFTSEEFRPFAEEVRQIDWMGTFLSIRAGILRDYQQENFFPTHFAIPYPSIVLPLMLLSAWLLFTKPRTKKPRPTSET